MKNFLDRTYTKFGIKKPISTDIDGWDDYEQHTKSTAPLVCWIGDAAWPKIKKFVSYPYSKLCDLRYWIYNGFISKSHCMTSDLEFGTHHEIDTRILHSSFQTLVDFIEIEKAWMHCLWNDEARKKFLRPWWCNVYILRLKRWRCPEAGLAHLQWEIDAAPESQAESAKEQLALYDWWKNRSKRRDPWSIPTEVSRELDAIYSDLGLNWMFPSRKNSRVDEVHVKRYQEALDMATALEEQYEKEDDKMLLRLIKIRRHLWT
jgi:hypothetical protein